MHSLDTQTRLIRSNVSTYSAPSKFVIADVRADHHGDGLAPIPWAYARLSARTLQRFVRAIVDIARKNTGLSPDGTARLMKKGPIATV